MAHKKPLVALQGEKNTVLGQMSAFLGLFLAHFVAGGVT